VAFCIFTSMFYIYILFSEGADLYYIGHTDDYNRRFIEHNSSDRNTYSAKHRPWKFAAVFECGNNRGKAMKIETFIKKKAGNSSKI
jgi:putative endonuclease